jgi:hypothetical protein
VCVFVGAGCACGKGELWERKEVMMRRGIGRAGGGVLAYMIVGGRLLKEREGLSFQSL